MKKLTISLPEEVNEKEILMTVAAILFEKAIFSSGQAADFAGITKREFLESAGKYGISVFGENPEDLRSSSLG